MAAMPSDGQIIQELNRILEAVNWHNTTARMVRHQLEAKLGVILSEKKAMISQQIDLFMNAHPHKVQAQAAAAAPEPEPKAAPTPHRKAETSTCDRRLPQHNRPPAAVRHMAQPAAGAGHGSPQQYKGGSGGACGEEVSFGLCVHHPKATWVELGSYRREHAADGARLFDAAQLLVLGPHADTNLPWHTYRVQDLRAAAARLEAAGVDVLHAVHRSRAAAAKALRIRARAGAPGLKWDACVRPSQDLQAAGAGKADVVVHALPSVEDACTVADCLTLAMHGLSVGAVKRNASSYAPEQLQAMGQHAISKGVPEAVVHANLADVLKARADGTLDAKVPSLQQRRADYMRMEAAGLVPPEYTYQRALAAFRAGKLGPRGSRRQAVAQRQQPKRLEADHQAGGSGGQRQGSPGSRSGSDSDSGRGQDAAQARVRVAAQGSDSARPPGMRTAEPHRAGRGEVPGQQQQQQERQQEQQQQDQDDGGEEAAGGSIVVISSSDDDAGSSDDDRGDSNKAARAAHAQGRGRPAGTAAALLRLLTPGRRSKLGAQPEAAGAPLLHAGPAAPPPPARATPRCGSMPAAAAAPAGAEPTTASGSPPHPSKRARSRSPSPLRTTVKRFHSVTLAAKAAGVPTYPEAARAPTKANVPNAEAAPPQASPAPATPAAVPGSSRQQCQEQAAGRLGGAGRNSSSCTGGNQLPAGAVAAAAAAAVPAPAARCAAAPAAGGAAAAEPAEAAAAAAEGQARMDAAAARAASTAEAGALALGLTAVDAVAAAAVAAVTVRRRGLRL